MVVKKFNLRFLNLIAFAILSSVIISTSGNNNSIAGDPPPPGSYQRTCTAIYYNASADRISSAFCNDLDGKRKTTWMENAQACSNKGGDIANCNGVLMCTGIRLPNGGPLPNGSYKKSCFCCKIEAGALSCYCNPKKGKAKETILYNVDSCTKDIANCNGNLRCGGC